SLPVEGDDDNEGNKLKASGHDVHALHRLPGSDFRTLQRVEDIPADAKLVVRTHAPVTTPFPFNDLVPSWNIDAPPGGFVVELRLGPAGTQDWTPWYYLGSWGEKLEPPAKHTKDDHGFINIDYFQSRNRF